MTRRNRLSIERLRMRARNHKTSHRRGLCHCQQSPLSAHFAAPHSRPGAPQDRRHDEGGIAILSLGLAVTAGMLIAGGVSVTATQLARSDIMDATAHASAAAADRISTDVVYRRGVDALVLDPSAARAEATSVVAATPLPRHVASWNVQQVTVTGNQVRVTVRAVVTPPVIGSAMGALGRPLTVTVTSQADAHLANTG